MPFYDDYENLYVRSRQMATLDNVMNIAMIFGPILPFLPQAKLIIQNETLGNFSIATCFILINLSYELLSHRNFGSFWKPMMACFVDCV